MLLLFARGGGLTLTGQAQVVGQDQMSLFTRQRRDEVVLVMVLRGGVEVDGDGLLFVRVGVDQGGGEGCREGEEAGEPHPSTSIPVSCDYKTRTSVGIDGRGGGRGRPLEYKKKRVISSNELDRKRSNHERSNHAQATVGCRVCFVCSGGGGRRAFVAGGVSA